MSQHRIYPVGEDEILRISQLVTSFESAVKEIVRRAGDSDARVPDFHQIEFCRHVSEAMSSEDDASFLDLDIF